MRFWTVVAAINIIPITSNAALVFFSGPLQNTSIYCATVNKAIGPQASPRTAPVVARLIVYDGTDSCSSDSVDVLKKIVYLKDNNACADERVYENFYARGALAIIRATLFFPGSDYNMGNPSARHYKDWNDIPFLEIRHDHAPLVLANDNEIVSVAPDPNLWQPLYTSSVYQVLLRWLPSTVAFVTSMSALNFLMQHIRIIKVKYLNTTPLGDEAVIGCLVFAMRHSSVSVVVLSIELLSSFTLAVIWSVGGLWSTSNISAPVIRFFATQLSGFAYITTILSARFWHHMEAELVPPSKPGAKHGSPSFFQRILRGDFTFINILGLSIPLLLDLSLAFMYATYMDRQYPSLPVINALTFVSIDLVIGIYFLIGSVKLQMQMGALLRKLQRNGESLRRFRIRMIRCAFGLSISMLAIGGSTVVVGFADSWYSTPLGWTVSWSIFTNFRILQSMFHVIMFRPVPGRPDSTNTHGGMGDIDLITQSDMNI